MLLELEKILKEQGVGVALLLVLLYIVLKGQFVFRYPRQNPSSNKLEE